MRVNGEKRPFPTSPAADPSAQAGGSRASLGVRPSRRPCRRGPGSVGPRWEWEVVLAAAVENDNSIKSGFESQWLYFRATPPPPPPPMY